jgi:hypothetical protein
MSYWIYSAAINTLFPLKFEQPASAAFANAGCLSELWSWETPGFVEQIGIASGNKNAGCRRFYSLHFLFISFQSVSRRMKSQQRVW